MTDPTDALISFQEALRLGNLDLQRGELDSDLVVHLDHPIGKARFTYGYISGTTVTALAIFALVEPLGGLPCFHVGVAVPEPFRDKGLAKKIIAAGIAELRHGMARNKVTALAFEAIVSKTNHPSKKVADEIFSKTPKEVTDEFSGEPALQYVLKFTS